MSKLERMMFERLDHFRFWELRSGRAVEDLLFTKSLQNDAPVGIRSCTIDFYSETIKIFSQKKSGLCCSQPWCTKLDKIGICRRGFRTLETCVANTMGSYQRLQDTRIDENDNNWIYGNDSSVDLIDETLASSPVRSP
ncbi:MAG: hypothetical protein J3Q66DRAFT_368789 [Benniella sp.]|nr:MAG: hypothetical protein J3Q66DRAFT_368789 [Benniella sp.]